MSVVDGTDTGNSVGDYVEMLPTAAWGQDLADALTTLHNRDGTWKTGAALTQPTIADHTNATHTHASTAQGGQLTGAAIATGSQLADRLLNPYKFSVYRNAAANTGNGALALITFDTKLFDTGSNYSTSTGLFTAPIAGFYLFKWTVSVSTANNQIITSLFINGVDKYRGSAFAVTSFTSWAGTGMEIVHLAANDTASIEAQGDAARALQVGANPYFTLFSGFLVSAT